VEDKRAFRVATALTRVLRALSPVPMVSSFPFAWRTRVSAPHKSSQIEIRTANNVHLSQTQPSLLRCNALMPTALRHYHYRRRLPHISTDSPLFVTFCKLAKDPFPPLVRAVILEHCLYDNGKKIDLHAAVVMPEHVHLLFTPLHDPEGWPFSLLQIMKGLKGASARSVNRAMRVLGPVWQEESFDHVLRSNESMQEKIEYIRQNPVRRGLVKKSEDYPWLWIEKM
jgi:REP element-mobilizing transposase RayT